MRTPPDPAGDQRPRAGAHEGSSGFRVYRERLHVPLRWWVQATMLLASVWLAFVVALPAWAALTATGVLVAIALALFWWAGRAVVEVRDGQLWAGRAHVDLRLLGDPEALDTEDTRRALGVDADARAYLLTRPYLKRSVRVALRDPADPTPYWLVQTRHPRRLAQALVRHDGSVPPATRPSAG